MFCFKPLLCSLEIALFILTAGCTIPASQSEASQLEASPFFVESPQPQSFAQWCKHKNSVPVKTQHTINVLLKIAETDNCESADAKLSAPYHSSLTLQGKGISDLRPIASFKQLDNLVLGDNQINDLTPLAHLSNLEDLLLNNNRISDLRPLAGLSTVGYINLSDNQISDLRPLSNLSTLYNLNLSRNQISELPPMGGMKGLRTLDLRSNRIRDVKPLAELPQLELLVLNDNQITDLRSLSSLHTLQQLHAHQNPLSTKECPVKRTLAEPFASDPFLSILFSAHANVCRFD